MDWSAHDALLKRLDADQRAVVAWRPPKPPPKVVASAGSGKTTTAVALIGALIRARVFTPDRIVLTTFTRKGGEEFLARLRKTLPDAALDGIRVGTFHALGLGALRRLDADRWNVQVRCVDVAAEVHRARGYREVSTQRGAKLSPFSLVYRTVALYGGNDEVEGLRGRAWLQPQDAELAVEYVRARCNNPDAPEFYDGLREREAAVTDTPLHACQWDRLNVPNRGAIQTRAGVGIAGAYAVYRECLRAAEGFDFGDVLAAWAALLHETPEPSADLVIVDEAQDNNPVNLTVAAALLGGADAAKERLITIGDHRQAIYGFRGADMQVFLDAPGEVYPLRYNYRSGSRIVAAGNAAADGLLDALSEDGRTVPKTPDSAAGRTSAGTLKLLAAPDERTVIQDALAALSKGTVCILHPMNSGVLALEMAAIICGVQPTILGGRSMFALPEIDWFVSWARLLDAAQPRDVQANALRSIISGFEAPFSRTVEVFTRTGDLLGAVETSARGDERFAAIAPLVRSVVSRADWRMAAAALPRPGAPWRAKSAKGAQRPDDTGAVGFDPDRALFIETARWVAGRFKTSTTFVNAVEGRRAAMARAAQRQRRGEPPPAGTLSLGTIHQAKGQEWSSVFLYAGRTIDKRSNKEDLLPPAWNRWYVGITRAADVLTYWRIVGASSPSSAAGDKWTSMLTEDAQAAAVCADQSLQTDPETGRLLPARVTIAETP